VTRFFASRHPPRLEQAALARFISEGHFARHVRRMRALYAHRQQALIAALERDPIAEIRIDAAPAGLHLLGRLSREADDRQISLELAKAGIDARPLSEFAIRRKLPPALILGYTGINERAIREAVRRMRRVFRDSST
jgi:GntR family transcriptional regulator/MocR family aminotransferase